MAKINWLFQNEQGTNLNRYKAKNVSTGEEITFDLFRNGNISVVGTPLNAENMNSLINAINEVYDNFISKDGGNIIDGELKVENDEGYSKITPYTVVNSYGNTTITMSAEERGIDISNIYSGNSANYYDDGITFHTNNKNYNLSFPKKQGELAIYGDLPPTAVFEGIQFLDSDGSTEVNGNGIYSVGFGRTNRISLSTEIAGLEINDDDDTCLVTLYGNGNIRYKTGPNKQNETINLPKKSGTLATLDDIPSYSLPSNPEFDSVTMGETEYLSDHINYKGYSLDFPETDGTLATLDDISSSNPVTKLWSGQKTLAELYTREYYLHDWMLNYNFLILNVYYNGDDYFQGCLTLIQSIYMQDEGVVVGILTDAYGNTMTYNACANSQEGFDNSPYSADDMFVTSIYGFGG